MQVPPSHDGDRLPASAFDSAFPETSMHSCTRFLACAVIAVASFGAQLAAQDTGTLSGRLVNSLSTEPVAQATVQIDELRRTTTSGADGTFSFTGVPSGTYHLSIRSQGYSTRRTEVVVPT